MSALARRTTPIVTAVGIAGVTAVAMLLAMRFSGAFAVTQLRDPGAAVRLGLPLARAVHDLSATVAVGLLTLAALAIGSPGPATGRLGGARSVAVRWAGVAAMVWTMAATAVLVLTYADVAGVPLGAPGFGAQLTLFLTEIDLGRILLAGIVGAALVVYLAAVATRTSTCGWAAIVAVMALLPTALAGHAAGSESHGDAVTSLGIHLVAVAVWVGGLAALVLLHRRLGDGLAVTASRYSTAALVCFLAVGVSGVVNASLRVRPEDVFSTRYGVLVLLKTAALVVLCAAGWWHRRTTLPALTGSRGSRAFVRFAVVELTVMSLAMGIAVALSRSAPPVPQIRTDPGAAVRSVLGFDPPPPADLGRYFTVWHTDLLWLCLTLCGAAVYAVGVRRLRRRGVRWPWGRTICWYSGMVLLTWVTSGGPGVYGRVSFSGHMLQHMSLMMAVPALLVLSAPVTLALRTLAPRSDGSTGPREWLLLAVHSRVARLASHPLVAAGIFAGSLVVFYYTPLFELALTTHVGHVLMCVHFLAAGYVFASVLVGVDPGPARPSHPLRLVLLLATLSFHAFFALTLMALREVLAVDWFAQLGLRDAEALLADQHTGAEIAWAAGELPTVLLILVVAVSWARSDERQGRREDRTADRDGDAALAAYNRWLSGFDNRS